MNYFFSTGEASGEASAVALAEAIRECDPQARFEGIGAQRMRDSGFTLWRDHTGWASMGPIAAIPRIPKLLATMWRTAAHLARTKPDLVILVDFGAFNVRLARELRRKYGYALPVMDWFPPGAWLDNERLAREIARLAVPLTAFEHQYEFYRRLQLPIAYFGHPTASRYERRAARVTPPPDAGDVAILPGSRAGELSRHVPLLRAAYLRLRETRPRATATACAADAQCEAHLRAAFAGVPGVRVVRGVRAAIESADAAWVASGTAVLETALSGVPSIALYVIAPLLVKHARRVYRGRYITLPNLVSGREIVPEFQQETATPRALCDAMESVLRDPSRQYAELVDLRAAFGATDALQRCAKFAVSLARAGRT